MKRFKGVVAGVLAVAVVGCAAATASAITCTSGNSDTTCGVQLTFGESALTSQGFTGPYLDLLITTPKDTTATLTFTSLTQTVGGQLYKYLMGDGASVAIQTDGTITGGTAGVSATRTTSLSGGKAPSVKSVNSDATVGIFGKFSQMVTLADGFQSSADKIVLTLGGLPNLLKAEDVLEANSDGFWAAGHVFVADCTPDNPCTNTLTTSNPTGLTAHVAGAGVPVPDPGLLTVLGTGLLVVAAMARRFNS